MPRLLPCLVALVLLVSGPAQAGKPKPPPPPKLATTLSLQAKAGPYRPGDGLVWTGTLTVIQGFNTAPAPQGQVIELWVEKSIKTGQFVKVQTGKIGPASTVQMKWTIKGLGSGVYVFYLKYPGSNNLQPSQSPNSLFTIQ